MNLFLLQFREELRRLRPFLPVWAACLVLVSLWMIGHATLPPRTDAPVDLFGGTPIAVILLVVVPVALLSKALGLADPALTPDAAWAPRPLRGATLASAKLAVVILVLLVPAAVAESTVTMILFGPAMLPAVWGYYFTAGLAGCAALVALGALAGSWERFAALVMLGLVLLVGVALLADQLGIASHVAPSLIASRILIATVAAALGSVALLYHQYTRRRPAEAYALAAAVFFACTAVVCVWPVDFYRRAPEDAAGLSDLRIVGEETRVIVDGPDLKKLRIKATAEGLPEDWLARGRGVRSQDGTMRGWCGSLGGARYLQAVARGATGAPPSQRTLPSDGDAAAGLEIHQSIAESDLARRTASNGTLPLLIELDLFRFEPLGSLRMGSEGVTGTNRVRVRKLDEGWNPGHLQVGLQYAIALPFLDRSGPWVRLPASGYSFPAALVDGDAARVGDAGLYLFEMGQNEKTLIPFPITRRIIQTKFPLATDEPNGVQAVEAVGDFPLVLLHSRYMGTVTCRLEVDLRDLQPRETTP